MRKLVLLAFLAAVAMLAASSAAAAEPGAQRRDRSSSRSPVRVVRTVSGPQTAAAPHAVAAAHTALVGQCRDDGCNGKQSADYGCDDDRLQIGGFTTTTNGHPTTDVIMWYSDNCQAVWGTYDEHGPDANQRQLTLQCLDEYSGQPVSGCSYLEWVTGHVTTTMGGWNHSFQLCVDLSFINDNAPCTGWR
jgi:hypothetical protein